MLTLLLLTIPAAPSDAPVSFRREVMAVLSRAGCNAGPCHGNLNGKGGLKLSLRGESPETDYLTLTRDMLGRRLAPLHAGESLLLAKATMRLPHEGGQRFSGQSPEAQLLRRWIAQGAKDDHPTLPVRLTVSPAEKVVPHGTDRVALKVVAHFPDGSQRDVTRLAAYEPSNLRVVVNSAGEVIRQREGEVAILVRYLETRATVRLAFLPETTAAVPEQLPANNPIDRLVNARLKALRQLPAELCDDSTFLRRAYLDACGIVPTAAETRAFLADRRPDKRAKLIDALLERPEFADFWALKWSDLLRNEEKTLDSKGVTLFHTWIRRALVDRLPLNEFAYEVLAARGSSYQHPAANFYRALRDPYARAEAAAQVFLGVRLQCAKCHNHPFDRWTQTDYHRFAALFARVQYRVLENNRRDRLDSHEFVGEQIIYQDRSSELQHPVSGQVLGPRFLGSEAAVGRDRLEALAQWVRDPANPFFARAQANRIWYHLIGRGLVDPLDDFRESNPALSEELLDYLAEELRKERFDLRHLVRLIMNSRVYQRSSVPPPEHPEEDETGLAVARIRPLQAEQLLDAITAVVGRGPRWAEHPAGLRAGQLPGALRTRQAKQSERFLAIFGKPARTLTCECERPEGSTLAQAFQLITGPVLHALIADPDNRLGQALQAGLSDEDLIEELYLHALSRFPTPPEKAAAKKQIVQQGRRAGLEDVLWCLLNAKEFLLRR